MINNTGGRMTLNPHSLTFPQLGRAGVLFSKSKIVTPTQNNQTPVKSQGFTHFAQEQVLYRLSAVWPFDLFPDELIIRENSVSVRRRFLLYSYLETLPIRDIGRTVLVNAVFFACLIIMGKTPLHELHIKNLPKRSARRAKIAIDELLLKQGTSSQAVKDAVSGPQTEEELEESEADEELAKNIPSEEDKPYHAVMR